MWKKLLVYSALIVAKLLYGLESAQLTDAQKKKLYSNRQHLRNLASKSVSPKKKKRILNQKGGFLPLLGSALIPLLGKAVIGGIGGAIKAL